MKYFTEETISFLSDLRENNKREWFHENKVRYETFAKKPFHKFIDDVIFMVSEFDKDINQEPKTAIFRINRDIRFTKDKSPYKTHLGASFNGAKRTQPNRPGYYIHLSQDNLMIGGGMYFTDKNGTFAIREAIKSDLSGFKRIINNKQFKAKFGGTILGDKNKRLPREFIDLMEKQPLIANKNFYYMVELPVETAFKEDLLVICKEYLKAASIMNSWFKNALRQWL